MAVSKIATEAHTIGVGFKVVAFDIATGILHEVNPIIEHVFGRREAFGTLYSDATFEAMDRVFDFEYTKDHNANEHYSVKFTTGMKLVVTRSSDAYLTLSWRVTKA